MKYTHAVIPRIPDNLKFDDKKTASKTDLALVRKQQIDFNDTLKEAGLELIELPTEESTTIHSLFVDDMAISILGTTLITRPKKPANNAVELVQIMRQFSWQMVEAPQQEHGKTVVLEGSDVLYTGKEIFVGIRKNGTNIEGGLVVARTFADLSVIPIPLNGNSPLKSLVSLAASGDLPVLSVSKSKESQNVLRRIERDATFRYKVLTVENDEAINCINVNDHLIFRHDLNESKFRVLQQPTELWGITIDELVKIGTPFSKFCLLVNKFKLTKS